MLAVTLELRSDLGAIVSSTAISSSNTATPKPAERISFAFIRHPPVDHVGEKESATVSVTTGLTVDEGHQRLAYGSGAPAPTSQSAPWLVVLIVALAGWIFQVLSGSIPQICVVLHTSGAEQLRHAFPFFPQPEEAVPVWQAPFMQHPVQFDELQAGVVSVLVSATVTTSLSDPSTPPSAVEDGTVTVEEQAAVAPIATPRARIRERMAHLRYASRLGLAQQRAIIRTLFALVNWRRVEGGEACNARGDHPSGGEEDR